MKVRELALFPLQVVLFPGGPLQLRVFEARYLDMVRRCMREDDVFGVVLIRDGTETGPADIHEVGTTAKICDWHTTSDGLLGIKAFGQRSFRVLETVRQSDGLLSGTVRMYERPAEGDPLRTEHDGAVDILRRLLPLAGEAYVGATQAFDDAAWVSGRLAELLPVDNALKQMWLQMSDPGERLTHMLSLVLPDEDEQE